jgi:hypothetical protein
MMKKGIILYLVLAAVPFGTCGQLGIASSELPDGDVGIPYSFSLTATNGVPPYSWYWFAPGDAPYTVSSGANSFAATGTAQGWYGDQSAWGLYLPFDFPFFGESHSFCWVHSKGKISFGDNNFFSPSRAGFIHDTSIAVLWSNLETWSGDIYVDSTVSSVTIRWQARYNYSSSPASFSVTLHDSGVIVMKYGSGNYYGGIIGISAGNGIMYTESMYSNSGSMDYAGDIMYGPIIPTNTVIAGLNLSTNGLISGTPTHAFSNQVLIAVMDSFGDVDGRLFELVLIDDRDVDGMLDEWERIIIDDNPSDGIETIYDVLRDDNYDGDAFSNIEEHLLGFDPVVPDGDPLDTIQEGLDLFAVVSTNEPFDRAYAALIDNCFATVVAAEPANYAARVYRAASRLFNLINHEDLDGFIAEFGGTLRWDLEVLGDFDDTNAPLPNAAVDFFTTNVLPAIDASFADLASIPADWNGVVEISTNYFPVDETVYADIGDVTAAMSALQLARSKILFLSAQSWNFDYEKLLGPMDGPFAAITVDGMTNDWSGIPVQLYGRYDYLFQAVKAAWDHSAVYLLVEVQGIESNVLSFVDGRIDLTTDTYLDLQTSPAWGFTNIWFSETGTNTETLIAIFTNNVFEIAIPIPPGIAVSNAGLDWLGYEHFPVWGEWWMATWDDLDTPDSTPVEVLFQNHPELLTSIRSDSSMQTAKAYLHEAIDLSQLADQMIQARTDSLMHFIEYDPTNELERIEFFNRLAEAEQSLSDPQIITVTNGYGETGFEDTVHFGAMFEPDYLTRGMLPGFWRILPQPLDNTLPDPTFGGILPEATATRLEEYMLIAGGLPDCDEDGLSDGWEYRYYGHPTAGIAYGDDDGDGLSNYEEWFCGTDMTNAASCFRAEFIENDGGPGFVIHWDAVEGRMYEVQWASAINDGFRILASGITYPVNSYTDTLHSAHSTGFYRVLVRRPDSEDGDADGLPDDWERTFLGSRDEAGGGTDSDGDGQLNQEELIAGTDPSSDTSFFAVTDAAATTSGFVVEWVSMPDRIYSIQWAPEAGAAFHTLETGILYPGGSYTDTVHNAATAGFYKVNVSR